MKSSPNALPSRDGRYPIQESASLSLNLSSNGLSSVADVRNSFRAVSYGTYSERSDSPLLGQSSPYDLSSSTASIELYSNNQQSGRVNRQDSGIKMQQPSINPPPLPPSRRRTSSGDRNGASFLRSGSGEYEPDALSPRSSSGSAYPYSNFAAPPKAPRPQRHTHTLSLVSHGSASSNNPPKSPSSINHRRTHSFDIPERKPRRQSSSGSLVSLNSQGHSPRLPSETLKSLPDPRWGGGSGGRSNRARTMSGSSFDRGHRKVDSYSSQDGLLFPNGGGGYAAHQYGSMAAASKDVIMNGTNNVFPFEQSGGHHRRAPSEVSTTSFASALSVDRSIEPARIDLAKSSMFKDVTSQGIVRLQLPKDNFRLLADRDLEPGYVYKRQLIDNEGEYFQDFHTTEDSVIPLHTASGCNCLCDNCNHCHTRRKTLPPTYYVMSVKSDIYRRMFDEVSESKSMPCGLFFCGHHEDVRYPSIMIAVAIVSAIFVAMLVATIYVKD